MEEGKVIRVEKLPYEKGETLEFEKVLMCVNGEETKIGTPYLEDCRVEGKIVGTGRGRKLIVYKYKPKKNYRRKQGHRQPYTDVLIGSISSQ